MATLTFRPFKGARLMRFGLSGGIAAGLIYAGLWAAAQLPIGPSDVLVELFTTRGPASMQGLWEGILYAALIGFFAGAITDLVFEALRWLEQR
jgi:hypothetical protein